MKAHNNMSVNVIFVFKFSFFVNSIRTVNRINLASFLLITWVNCHLSLHNLTYFELLFTNVTLHIGLLTYNVIYH